MKLEDLTSFLGGLASRLDNTEEAALAVLGIAAISLPSTLSVVGVAQTAIEMDSTIKDTRRALLWWWERRKISKQIPARVHRWDGMSKDKRKALLEAVKAVFALDDEFARVMLKTTDVDKALFAWFRSAGASEDMAKALRDLVQNEMHQLLLNNPELLDHLQFQGIMALRQAIISLGGDTTRALRMLEQIKELLIVQLVDQINHKESLRFIAGLKTFREIVRDIPGKEPEPFRHGPPIVADFAAGFVVAPKKMLGKVAKGLGLGVPTLDIKGPVIPDERFAAVTLFGHPGSGKTYLALTLAYELEQFGWDIFSLDVATFERLVDRYVFIRRIVDAVRERYLGAGTDITDDPPRVLLIVENIHMAPEFASDFLSTLKHVCEDSQSGGLIRLLLVGRPLWETRKHGSLTGPIDTIVERSVRIDMEPFSETTVANMLAIVKRRRNDVQVSTDTLIEYAGGDNFLIVTALKIMYEHGSRDVLRDTTALARHVWHFCLEHIDVSLRNRAASVLCFVAAFSSIGTPVLARFVAESLRERVAQVADIIRQLADTGFLRTYQFEKDSSQVFVEFYHSRYAQIILGTCKDTNPRTLHMQYLDYNPPDFVRFATALALWGAHSGDNQLLSELFNQVIEREDCVAALRIIGVNLMDTNLRLATRAFRRITELSPDDAGAWNNLGNLLAKQRERWDEAEEAYRRAIELSPDDAGAWNNIGILLAKQERWDEAEAAYRKAIELRPGDAEVWYNLGVLLARRKRWDEAEVAFRTATELRKDSAMGWYGLGLVRLEQGQTERTAQALSHAIRLRPDLAKECLRLAAYWRERGSDENAEAVLQAVLDSISDEQVRKHADETLKQKDG